MSQSIAELRRHLSRVTPWIAVAVFLAVVLLGYYAFLGFRYLKESDEVDSLTAQQEQLTTILSRIASDQEALKAQEDSRQQQFDDAPSLFNYLESYYLVGILSDTAQESSINLERITVADERLETEGGIEYSIQPMSATIRGETLDIYRFLSLLQEKVPGTSIVNISMSSLEGLPLAQVQLLFYLSAETISEG